MSEDNVGMTFDDIVEMIESTTPEARIIMGETLEHDLETGGMNGLPLSDVVVFARAIPFLKEGKVPTVDDLSGKARPPTGTIN